jgi:hypothetical protein
MVWEELELEIPSLGVRTLSYYVYIYESILSTYLVPAA